MDAEEGTGQWNKSSCRRGHHPSDKDYTLGYKLPGAGGEVSLYMVAKDPQAALRIRETLTLNVPNPRARFVEMSLSDKGFQVSRS